MRRIFIALIAGGLLLVSGVAASAKLDGSSGEKGQHGQQQNQTQTDKKATPAAKVTDKAETEAADKPATAAPKPATPAAKLLTPAPAQCGETGDNTGDHQNDDKACTDQMEQAGANESKTEANDKAEAPGKTEAPGKDDNQQGNSQD